MCSNETHYIIRRMAGIFVLVSLALGYWVSPWFFLVDGVHGPEPPAVELHQVVPGGEGAGEGVRGEGASNQQ